MDEFLMSRPTKKTAYVISPAFPQTNTTYNVSESQLKIIESHFTEAFKVIRLIMLGELEWYDLASTQGRFILSLPLLPRL